jgi:hypothetical protein
MLYYLIADGSNPRLCTNMMLQKSDNLYAYVAMNGCSCMSEG